MRIWAVSDLHTDFRENREALFALPYARYADDALIVAGDVADGEAVIGETLEFLAARFREVFFVPGNHELWVRDEGRDSLEKFHAVLRLCDRLGVRTAPARVGDAWVVPLFSWYDASFDVRGEGDEASLEAWSDRYFCRWPPDAGRTDELFLAMNEPHVRRYDAPVITFSHFVPRPDLLPPAQYLRFRGLPLVAGSEGIEAQIRRIRPRVHVYGHTHIPGDETRQGVRYVQNWFRRPAAGSTHAPWTLVWRSAETAFAGPVFC